MTCIAWDGKTLSADRRCCIGGSINTVTKIRRIGGLLAGGAGEVAFISEMFEWVEKGRISKEFPASQRNKDDWQPFLVIELDGTPSLYDRTPHPIRFEQVAFSIGSGKDYARAALHLGKTSREAVDVAIALDSGCGGGVDTLTLELEVTV